MTQQPLNRKWRHIEVMAEFLLGAILGIYFHWVLHDEGAAYIVFATGIMLSLAIHLLQGDITHTREALLDQVHQTHEIAHAIAQIKDDECRKKAHDLLATVQKNLSFLQRGYVPLDETEFYLEGTNAMGHASALVKTVDPLTVGWDSRGALLNYYEANLKALQRGVRIVRIFAIHRSRLTDHGVQNILRTHFHDNVDVRIAFREDLPIRVDDYSNWSFDFALFDDRVVTDRGGDLGNHFGRKTSLSSEVNKYIRLFALIEHNAYSVSMENGNIMPIAATHSLV